MPKNKSQKVLTLNAGKKIALVCLPLLVASTAVLTGCSSAKPDPVFTDITQVQKAIKDAGIPCFAPEVTKFPNSDSTDGHDDQPHSTLTCQEADGPDNRDAFSVSLYESQKANKDVFDQDFDSCAEGVVFQLGSNWVILYGKDQKVTSADFQNAFGGQTFTCKQ